MRTPSRRRLTLVATTVIGLLPAVLAHGDGGPRYSYAPRVIAPGGSITVTGTQFEPATSARLSLISVTGDFLLLGIGPVSEGAFNRTFVVPSTVAPGRYFVSVYDSVQRIAINLVGAITVTAPGRPWFTYAPTTAAPGETVTVSASGFDQASTTAVAGVVDAVGQGTVLGTGPLVGGAMSRTFTVPAGLVPGMYFPFVRDLAPPVFALNLEGPLTVATDLPPLAVPVGSYPIGAAVNVLTERVYIPNGGDDTLSVLDGGGNAVATIPIGGLPCAIGLNPRTNRVYVSNVNTHDVSVVDGATQTVIATVPAGRHPCAVGVLPALNRAYIGNYTSNTISVIDGATNAVIDTIDTGRGPFGIAANPVTNRVYVVNGYDNTVSAIDGATGSVVATTGVGRAPDAVGVNPVNNRVYVANFFSNTVTVLDGALSVLATVPTGREPDGVAVDWMTNRVYVSNYSSNTVNVIDGATHTVVDTIPVGVTPDGLTVNPLTGDVYISNSNSNSVSILRD